MPNILSVKPSLAGMQRSVDFQEEPPFSAYDLVNVWPVDVHDGHASVATRPPLSQFESPGLNVNMLAQLNLPDPTAFAAREGKLYKFVDGAWSLIESDFGLSATRALSVAPFVKKLFFANDGAPAYYDDDTGDLLEYAADAGKGTIPQNCRLIAEYAGCIWLAGAPESPHLLYSSRIGDPFDWDFSLDDASAAFGGTSDLFGVMSEPITALIPLQGRMLICSENSIYLLTGHPRRNGELVSLSRSIGVLGNEAWTFVPSTSDELYFLSKMGVHKMQTESLRRDLIATPVSRYPLPDELIGLGFNYLDPTVCMAYDSRWQGVVLTDRTSEQSFLLDVKGGGFFRQTFDSFPTVMKNFDSFVTENASGLLFGGNGYGGLARFDRTGSEAFDSYQIVGPVKISQSPLYSNLIQRASVILGGGSNDLTGTVTFYVGNSAHTALLRAINDSSSYSFQVTIGSLIGSGKLSFPRLRNHAVVMKIEGSGEPRSRIVFAGCDLELVPGGRTKDLGLIAPVFSGPSGTIAMSISALPPGWSYSTDLTPDNPASSLTDFSFILDMSLLPDGFWAAVAADGGDIRVTHADDTRLAMDLVAFDKVAKTGTLVFKNTKTTSSQTYKVWAGNPDATAAAADDEFGQYNAYDANWYGFWPTGGGLDRTSHLNHCESRGAVVAGDTNGVFGAATTYPAGSGDYSFFNADTPSAYPASLVCMANQATVSSSRATVGIGKLGVRTGLFGLFVDSTSTQAYSFLDGSPDTFSENTAGTVIDTWYHIASVFSGSSSRTAYQDGAAGTPDTTAQVMSGLDYGVIGTIPRPAITTIGGTGFFLWDGLIWMAQVHNIVRSADWIAYQESMLSDPATFWNL